MRKGLLVVVVLLVAAPVRAQLGAGWSAPMPTPASEAVRQAAARGLCDQAGIEYVRALGVPAVVTNAGAPWPADRHVVMWYRKGPNCSGAYQYVPDAQGGGDRGPQGGYRDGWEAAWSDWVPGPGDATHPTDPQNGDHPTTFKFAAGSTFDPSYVGGIVTPPVPVPTPPPVVQPPIVVDVSAILAKLDEIERQNAANAAAVEAAVNHPSWLSQLFGNKYVQMLLTGFATWATTKALQ